MTYDAARGYGFEPSSAPVDVVRKKGTDLTKDFVTSTSPILFSVKLPEGNYKVTLTLGDTQETSCTTVKSEVRRLMKESLSTGKGEVMTVTFGVNVRTPELSKGNEIKLNSRELDYGTGIDGAYLFSLGIVQAIKDLGLGLSQHILPDTPAFDAKNPKPLLKDFTCPIEPRRTARRPAATSSNGQTEFGPL